MPLESEVVSALHITLFAVLTSMPFWVLLAVDTPKLVRNRTWRPLVLHFFGLVSSGLGAIGVALSYNVYATLAIYWQWGTVIGFVQPYALLLLYVVFLYPTKTTSEHSLLDDIVSAGVPGLLVSLLGTVTELAMLAVQARDGVIGNYVPMYWYLAFPVWNLLALGEAIYCVYYKNKKSARV
jgi:hypothetical protein